MGRVGRLGGGAGVLPPVTAGLTLAYLGATLGADQSQVQTWANSAGPGQIDFVSNAANAFVSATSGKKKCRYEDVAGSPPNVTGSPVCLVVVVARVGNGGSVFQDVILGNSGIALTNAATSLTVNANTIYSGVALDTAQHTLIAQKGADWRLYIDGTDVTTGTGRTDTWTSVDLDSGLTHTNCLKYAAILAYNRVLTAAERAALVTWGLAV